MNYTQLKAAIIAYTENQDASFEAEIPVFVKQAEQRIYNTVQIANLRKNVTGVLTAGNKYLQCPLDFLSTYSLAIYPQASTTATGNSGAATITVASASGIEPGMYASGTGIATGAVVVLVNGLTVTLSLVNAGAVSGTVEFQGNYTYLLNRDVNYIREIYHNPSYRAAPKYYAIFGPRTDAVNELTFILGPTPNLNYAAELHFYYYPPSIVDAGTSWLGDNFDSALLYGSLLEAYTYMKGEQDMMALYDTKFKEAILLLKNLGDGKQRGDAYLDGQVKVPVR
jgi:hypothetical protein